MRAVTQATASSAQETGAEKDGRRPRAAGSCHARPSGSPGSNANRKAKSKQFCYFCFLLLATQSLSGHASSVESINFDAAEVLLAAGAASGTIKLWDLEEAKIVRTLTGHRSNCMSIDFHPFGEFFTSGSLDTNLKIWDIRRKGCNCIHTYKGHTRGFNAIRFTPDGRWVVSGGEDNAVKIWDLTAGKLLEDFKCHEDQIQCMISIPMSSFWQQVQLIKL